MRSMTEQDCRPSVALADYEISDVRTSAMSSLLLLFAILEGMCGFVLPICSAFSKPGHSLRRYYYEDFLFFQYCLSILALCYLQALIFYYDQKENISRKRQAKLMRIEEETEKSQSREELRRDYLTVPNPEGILQLPHPTIPIIRFHRVQFESQTSRNSNGMTTPGLPIYPTWQPVIDGMNESNLENQDHPLQSDEFDSTASLPGRDTNFQSPTMDMAEEEHFSDSDQDDGDKEEPSIVKRPSLLHRLRTRMEDLTPIRYVFGDNRLGLIRDGCYFSRDSEGINLYLRLGAVGFGFGVMIFDGFKIAEPWEASLNDSEPCHSQMWIPIHFLHFIYVFWQTYFLFKHHQVVFNVQKFVLRFLICHLAVANLCQWLKTIVDEISVDTHEESANHLSNLTSNGPSNGELGVLHRAVRSATTHTLSMVNATRAIDEVPRSMGHCRSTANYLAPFLFPCAIEYSLISGAIFYKMFQRIGHVQQESEKVNRRRQANTQTRSFTECHRSHKGLFIGLLLFMATLVTMCLFFIFFVKRDRRTTAITLYQCTELVLLALSTLTCIATMFRLRVLPFSNLSEEGAFDDNLLLVGLIGMIFYDLCLLVPALEAISTGLIAAKLFAAKAMLEIIQSMVQVFFIFEASRRGAKTQEHVDNKPGRSMITFLLILNLAMWFVNTFEVKRADNHSIHIDFYSEMAWKIITHLALPLIVFFRFHSTVCLSDIWANAYHIHNH